MVPGLERVRPDGRAALTFDDGPGSAPDKTPAVLDALEAAGARATFFLVGGQVGQAPALVREIIDRGHEVGVHARGHFRHDLAPVAESVADIKAGEAIGVRAAALRAADAEQVSIAPTAAMRRRGRPRRG